MMEKKESPIRTWNKLINGLYSIDEVKREFVQIYENFYPDMCEFTINSYCPNTCKHCIYPHDFHVNNQNISLEDWRRILRNVYDKLGLRTFVINGRSINEKIFEVIKFIKSDLVDANVGLIIDGTLSEKHLRQIKDIKIDWLDISVDGFGADHDNQRNNQGVFDKTVEMLDKLSSYNNFKKINILTTLTTINQNSVIEMIRFFNDRGFLNFFITPVSIYNNNPDPKLKPSNEEFSVFLNKLLFDYKFFSDVFISLNIFDVDYFKYLKTNYKDIYDKMSEDYNFLNYREEVADNVFEICFYPNSLNSTREFIINSDGKNILPLVVADSKIDEKYVFADLQKVDFNQVTMPKITQTKAFDFYIDLFLEEKKKVGKK